MDLSTFDGRLLDGLSFCRKVYAFFDQVKNGPDGIEKLRLLKTKNEKRLVEELIPIAHYVQAHYQEGHRIKVRWFSGSQRYDGVLLSSGILVEKALLPKRSLLEVTTAVHQNEHLVRQLINEGGASFGVKSISRDKKTKKIVSAPHVHRGNELANDLAAQILERLRDKGGKNYSPETILVVNCVTNSLIHDSEGRTQLSK
jgi:hypothetical protein